MFLFIVRLQFDVSLFIVRLQFHVIFVSVLCSQAPQPPPNFSDTYIVKGTLYVPYAEIREPFYVWYDLKLGASRIDYYGGEHVIDLL